MLELARSNLNHLALPRNVWSRFIYLEPGFKEDDKGGKQIIKKQDKKKSPRIGAIQVKRGKSRIQYKNGKQERWVQEGKE